MSRIVTVLVISVLCLRSIHSYRTNNGTFVERDIHETDEVITKASPYFNPYNQGFVGFYGEPAHVKRERVNEGAPGTQEFRRVSLDGSEETVFEVRPRQNCPGMVGPMEDGVYYCRGKEFGYCDRRSGTCFCNIGYQGVQCEECTPSHVESGGVCYPKRHCANIVRVVESVTISLPSANVHLTEPALIARN